MDVLEEDRSRFGITDFLCNIEGSKIISLNCHASILVRKSE